MVNVETAHVVVQRGTINITGARKSGTSVREGAARLLNSVCFNSLLALIVFVAIPYGTVEPWWEAAFECAVFAITGLWIVEALLSGSCRLRQWHLFLPLLSLSVFAWLQSWTWPGASAVMAGTDEAWRVISADPQATRQFAFKLLALVLVGMLLFSHLSTPRRLRALIVVIVGVGILSAIFGILRQTVQRGDGFILPYLMPEEGYAQFINRNHFAFLMEMSLGVVLGLLFGVGRHHDRLLIHVAAAVPLWAALVLSNSRGGIGSSLCQMLFLALLTGFVRTSSNPSVQSMDLFDRLRAVCRSIIGRVGLIVCLIATVLVGILWLGGDQLVGRLESLSGEMKIDGAGDVRGGAMPSGVRRVEVWRATWEMIKAHPIAGIGFSAYWVAIPRYHQASGELIPREAHNDYLEILASGGVIGSILVAWFVIAFVWSVCRRLRSIDRFHRAFRLGALTGLFGVAVHSLVDFGLHTTINALILTVLAAISVIDWRFERKAPA